MRHVQYFWGRRGEGGGRVSIGLIHSKMNSQDQFEHSFLILRWYKSIILVHANLILTKNIWPRSLKKYLFNSVKSGCNTDSQSRRKQFTNCSKNYIYHLQNFCSHWTTGTNSNFCKISKCSLSTTKSIHQVSNMLYSALCYTVSVQASSECLSNKFSRISERNVLTHQQNEPCLSNLSI